MANYNWAALAPYLTHPGDGGARGLRRRTNTVRLPRPGPQPAATSAALAIPTAVTAPQARPPTGIWPGVPSGNVFGTRPITQQPLAQAGAAQPSYDIWPYTGSYEQYPTSQWGFPAMDEMMRSLGFELEATEGGGWRWAPKYPGMQYDPAQVNALMAQTRDVLEPEMLRMIGGGEAALTGRGMERSSLMAGMQGGMRGEYMKEMLRKRLEIIQTERQRRWAQLLQVLGASTEASRSLVPQAQRPEEEGGGWGDLVGDLAKYWMAATAA